MSTWGTGPFDNDPAVAWLDDLEEEQTLTILQETFGLADFDEDGLAAAQEIVAAAEIIAGLRGHPAADLPDVAQQWCEAHEGDLTSALIDEARLALDEVLGHPMLEQWWMAHADEPDTGAYAAWRQRLTHLRARLG